MKKSKKLLVLLLALMLSVPVLVRPASAANYEVAPCIVLGPTCPSCGAAGFREKTDTIDNGIISVASCTYVDGRHDHHSYRISIYYECGNCLLSHEVNSWYEEVCLG